MKEEEKKRQMTVILATVMVGLLLTAALIASAVHMEGIISERNAQMVYTMMAETREYADEYDQKKAKEYADARNREKRKNMLTDTKTGRAIRNRAETIMAVVNKVKQGNIKSLMKNPKEINKIVNQAWSSLASEMYQRETVLRRIVTSMRKMQIQTIGNVLK